MKTNNSLNSVLFAAGAAGVALLTLADYLPADLGFATLSVAGLAAIVIRDYSRTTKSLRPLAPVLRPTLPAGRTAAPATRRVPAILEKVA